MCRLIVFSYKSDWKEIYIPIQLPVVTKFPPDPGKVNTGAGSSSRPGF